MGTSANQRIRVKMSVSSKSLLVFVPLDTFMTDRMRRMVHVMTARV